MSNTIYNKVEEYISDLCVSEDDSMTAAIKGIEQNEIPNMSISPNQGKFLMMMGKMCNAKKILELGTLGGYSTIWLAKGLAEGGRVTSIEYEEKYARVAMANFKKAGLDSRIEIRIGAGLDILPQLANENAGPFDLIFIDADKPPYTEYFQWAIKLGRPGTIIIADNVVREGKVLDKNSDDDKVQGVRRFNEYMSNCKEVTCTIMQTVGVKGHDGIAIAIIN